MNDYHVSSLVVYVSAEHAESVKKTIESLEGAEVPVSNEVGKMVVVLEGDSKDGLVERFDKIKTIPGVITVTLVYHQMDEQSELKEAKNDSQ
ncbi:chaperone NapD [Photobacterium chitinilyticum]|uniref:Chaperone NapD n=1 Tax=Photobacterium chitinilyticum TaxID=2485123 RepID=A0A3S3R226_9GAMM|nr:chaperone NapD [Photobacterium chitinilyticum]RWX56287.1 nitrate reductase [Photobacterium chitinilyticum]